MIDLRELKQALQNMKPRQKLYELVKTEMKRQGRWKTASRGKPFIRGHDERRSKNITGNQA